ncbi:MAG: hypothetical protein WCK01_02680 [Candidatus Uhrbacteria bacterium]
MRNPSTAQTSGVFPITTRTAANASLDTGNVPGVVIVNLLADTNVQPATLFTGAQSLVTVSFTTLDAIPSTGKIVVIFPSGYDLTQVAGQGTCLIGSGGTMDGSFSTAVVGHTVTITRSGGSSVGAGPQVCTISNVINPSSNGSAGLYTIKTTTSGGTLINADQSVTSDVFGNDVLAATNVAPNTLNTGASGTAAVVFITGSSVPADGKIAVTFPAGFDVSSAAGGACPGKSGSFVTSVVDHTITLTRTGGGSEDPGLWSCTIDNIVNPAIGGSTGAYAISTMTSGNVAIDSDAAVTSDIITPSQLTNTSFTPSAFMITDPVTLTILFHNVNPIPADGKIVFTLPTSTVTGANSYMMSSYTAGACPGMGGSFSSVRSGLTVTLTRTGGGAVPPGDQTCTITNISNNTNGLSNPFSIVTQSATGNLIDQDLSVPGSFITGEYINLSVTPASLHSGATSDVLVRFTHGADVPLNSKFVVTFPSGFDISGAHGGTCEKWSSIPMSGSFVTTVDGQSVTITRQGGIAEPLAYWQCTISGIVNPHYSGLTGTFGIKNVSASDQLVSLGAIAPAVTITAGTLTATSAQPASLAVNAIGSASWSFTTSNPIPADGKIQIIFPVGFTPWNATGGTCSSMDGTFAITTAYGSRIITLTRQGDGAPALAHTVQTCTVNTVKNPAVVGITGTYVLYTRLANDTMIDGGSAAGNTIIELGLTNTSVSPASLVVSAVSPATVRFDTTNSIPSDGKIEVVFPAGYSVSNSAVGSCATTMGGSFNTSVAGDVVTISRIGGSLEPAATETCTITDVTNPAVPGSTGVYEIFTKTAADAPIDSDTFVPPSIMSGVTQMAPAPTLVSDGLTSFKTILAQPVYSNNYVTDPYYTNVSYVWSQPKGFAVADGDPCIATNDCVWIKINLGSELNPSGPFTNKQEWMDTVSIGDIQWSGPTNSSPASLVRSDEDSNGVYETLSIAVACSAACTFAPSTPYTLTIINSPIKNPQTPQAYSFGSYTSLTHTFTISDNSVSPENDAVLKAVVVVGFGLTVNANVDPILTFSVAGYSTPSDFYSDSVSVDNSLAPDTCSFGVLSPTVPKVCAWYLNIATNASNGYSIYVVQDQDMLFNGNSIKQFKDGARVDDAAAIAWTVPDSLQFAHLGYSSNDTDIFPPTGGTVAVWAGIPTIAATNAAPVMSGLVANNNLPESHQYTYAIKIESAATLPQGTEYTHHEYFMVVGNF